MTVPSEKFIKGDFNMFSWAITFLVIALIAAALGFGGLAGTAAWAAKIVFIVGIILAILSFIFGRRNAS